MMTTVAQGFSPAVGARERIRALAPEIPQRLKPGIELSLGCRPKGLRHRDRSRADASRREAPRVARHAVPGTGASSKESPGGTTEHSLRASQPSLRDWLSADPPTHFAGATLSARFSFSNNCSVFGTAASPSAPNSAKPSRSYLLNSVWKNPCDLCAAITQLTTIW